MNLYTDTTVIILQTAENDLANECILVYFLFSI